MNIITYTITATFEDRHVGDQWIEWLKDDHIDAVLSAGATDVEVVRFDDPAWVVEARFHFSSREAFSRFESADAARLERDQTRRFPPSRGVQVNRTVGAVVHTQSWRSAGHVHAPRAGIVRSAMQGL